MKELVIDVTGINETILDSFNEKLSKCFYNKKGAFTELELNNKNYLLFAYEESEEAFLKNETFNLISTVVREQFKYDYIFKNLIIKDKKSSKFNLLVKVLTFFDREYDDTRIVKELSYKDYICIHSFFYFKLRKLTKKWEEIVRLTNKNSNYLLFNEGFYEYIRFIISNLEFKKEELSLFEKQGYYYIFSGPDELARVEKVDEVDLIKQIINFNPKKINISVSNKELFELLLSFFDNRVEV